MPYNLARQDGDKAIAIRIEEVGDLCEINAQVGFIEENFDKLKIIHIFMILISFWVQWQICNL